MRYLTKASQKKTTPVIASLHQVNIAEAFGDRFIGLRDGQVIFDGGPDELTTGVIDDLYRGVTTVTGAASTDTTDSRRSVKEKEARAEV